MKKLYATLFSALVVGCAVCAGCTTKKVSSSAEVVDIIHKVNGYWQTNHPEHGRSFWDNAAYHTGNMEAYFLTNKPEYLEYSKGWAEHNEWKGAKSDHKPTGSTVMAKAMIMYCSVIIRSVFRRMPIYIIWNRIHIR